MIGMSSASRYVALAAVTIGALCAHPAPAHAQSRSIVVRVSPTTIPYRPGRVPSQCLAYSVPARGVVVFCEGRPPTPYDVDVVLLYGGVKPWGWRTPDDCILRRGAVTNTGYLYCKTRHW